MDLSVACPLSTRLVTCLVIWCYMGRKLLKFCVIGIRKQKKCIAIGMFTLTFLLLLLNGFS